MFGTLHCNRQTNDVEFVERPNGSSKLEKHSACDRCRAKKVKCINQEDGCSRCQSLGKACTFSIIEQGRSRRRPQTTASISQGEFLLDLSNQPSAPTTDGEIMLGHQLPLELVTDKVSSITPSFDMSLFDEFAEQIRDQDEETSTYSLSPRPHFPAVYRTPTQLLTPSLNSGDEILHYFPPTSQSSDINMFNYETVLNTTSTSKHASTQASNMLLSQGPARQPCQCLAVAVFGVERCEASFNSASRAELDSIVACQKEAIKSCRTMLECGTCMAKRENIVLWIFMIEKIVAACGQVDILYRMTHGDKPAGSELHGSLGCLPTNEDSHRSNICDPSLPAQPASSCPFASERVRPGLTTWTRTGISPDWQELLLGDYEISSITEWNHVVGVIVLLQLKMIMKIIADIKCQASIILEETQKVKLEQSERRVYELARTMQCFRIG
ncbi:fungal Zn binuclear cluster domain-containing protein [Xylariaceae sp. AK1471]|nr:fungal Zn binuclear cluster domain-containing protein [Xylariaceae sp. AK1471]